MPGARTASPALDVLLAAGEMGQLVRALDWSATPLGAPENWSPALRTTVRILLANRFPQLLWWGPEYISIYNDAYRPILGRKHPWALGRPVSDCWSEIWDILKPLIDTPFKGGPATWSEDIELQINRAGFMEETHSRLLIAPCPTTRRPVELAVYSPQCMRSRRRSWANDGSLSCATSGHVRRKPGPLRKPARSQPQC
jgi:hypothetical protein